MNASCFRRVTLIICGLAWSDGGLAQAAGIAYEVVKSMDAEERVGGGPVAPLLEGSDGALYGSTRLAGTNTGTLFKINKDGSGYQALHVFGTVPNDGGRPFAQLVKGATVCSMGRRKWQVHQTQEHYFMWARTGGITRYFDISWLLRERDLVGRC